MSGFFRNLDKSNKDTGEIKVDDVYTDSKSKVLFCHFVVNKNKEVGKPIKKRIYDQEVTWKKRTWAIDHNRIFTDTKGIAHIYLDINDVAVLSFNKDHADKCKKCGGKMTVDAKNARDLVKRKTISALWSVDQLPMLLLIIMGIIMLVMAVIAFYEYTDAHDTHVLLQQYLKPVTTVTKP